MCDPVLIAAILEELGCFDEKKEMDNKEEVLDEKSIRDNLKHNGDHEK